MNTDRQSRSPLLKELDEALFGDAPLDSIAHHFESQDALLGFYASEIEKKYRPQQSSCEFCGYAAAEHAGFCQLNWHAEGKQISGIRGSLLVALFSALAIPVIMVLILLPGGLHLGQYALQLFRKKEIAIARNVLERDPQNDSESHSESASGLKSKTEAWTAVGDDFDISTHHSICRLCWQNQRLRQGATIAMQYFVGLLMTLCFCAAPILGAYAIACFRESFGFKFSEGVIPGLIALGLTAICIASYFVLPRLVKIWRLPGSHRSLVKPPFYLTSVKLI